MVFPGIQEAKHKPWMDAFSTYPGEDISETIAMNGSRNFLDMQNRAEDPPSIEETYTPSIDGHPEFRRRALHQNRKRKLSWESRNEYGVIPIVREQHTYIKVEIDELVAEIYRAMRTPDDYHSKWLDDIYYPFNNSLRWLTTHTDEMKQDKAMIQEQHAVGAETSKSIAAHTQPSINARIQSSIDARLASFEDRLQSSTYKLDGVYYPLRDDIDSLTTRMDALQQEMDTIQRQLDF